MFDPEKITDTFNYFRLFLMVLAVVPYIVVMKWTTRFWIKQALGADVLVVILSVFNVVFLYRQPGIAIGWDALNLILAVSLFYKTRMLGTEDKEKDIKFISIFWSFSFWLLGLIYVIVFPIGLAPLK
jgi:hypothetical protein